MSFVGLKKIETEFSKGDYLVVIGELFNQGYVNGLVRVAKEKGMNILYSTVGRRDSNGELRALTPTEVDEKRQSPLINIPIEAGFEYESANGLSLIKWLDQLQIGSALQATVNWQWVSEISNKGRERFVANMKKYLLEVEARIPNDANVLFVHSMAGGIPKADLMLAFMLSMFRANRDTFISSGDFLNSDVGKLCVKNFCEVTAETYRILIELSSDFRERLNQRGKKAKYIAYGYHGTEIYFKEKYRWQGGLYIQAEAKLLLEKYSRQAFSEGVDCTVFNVPEVISNSSKNFLGIEVPIYGLVGSLKKECGDISLWHKFEADLKSKLKPEVSVQNFIDRADNLFSTLDGTAAADFQRWPERSTFETVNMAADWSKIFKSMHAQSNDIIANELSAIINQMCGDIMLTQSWSIHLPVVWIGHDIISRRFWEKHT